MEFTKRTYTSTFALKTRCGDKVVLSSSSDVLLSRYVCIYKRGYRMRHVLLPSALSILKVCLLTCGNVCRKKKAKIRDRLKTIILFFFFFLKMVGSLTELGKKTQVEKRHTNTTWDWRKLETGDKNCLRWGWIRDRERLNLRPPCFSSGLRVAYITRWNHKQ